MMSSVIPARLVFQCGHAALVSLPRIKGETSTQRAERVAREKSDAQTRACDFCAQRLEVVVQAAPAAPLPVAPPPVAPAATAPTPVAPPPGPVATAIVPEPPEPVAPPPPTPPIAAPVHVPVIAVPVAKRPLAAVAKKPKNGKVVRAVVVAQNGKVARGTRFTVQFQAQAVVRAADVRDALRQAQSLGAIEVLAINRET
jgi:hypothetical protein